MVEGVLQGIGAHSLRGSDPISCKFGPHNLQVPAY